LEGKAINITNTNLTELDRLCEEFHFSELATKISEFRSSMDFKEGETETEDADARGRMVALEEEANQHSHVIVMLQDKVTQLSTNFHFCSAAATMISTHKNFRSILMKVREKIVYVNETIEFFRCLFARKR
jgi:hypothetical protein